MTMDAQTTMMTTSLVPLFSKTTIVVFGILMIRESVWKAIALYKAGTKKHIAWFVCLFVFNTIGILPIIYIAFFHNKDKNSKK